ncbi:MAG: thioredoxin domain-containing protein [Persephonella sp.]|nr:MAG: thioredoxin domain-containing protein [Persephonella sp.]
MDKRKPNKLINEKSPYLKQHAYNPVDWYPWGDEAFKKAKEEDKPIFLSIGYSTCHWCHVMEKESFEDEEIAKLMNETFINIKVDREERPDIDQFYMNICLMVRGHGGWPLTVIMTPDKKPFYIATYLPKESSYNRIGLKDLIKQIKDLWINDRKKILERAEKILQHYEDFTRDRISDDEINEVDIVNAVLYFKDRFDKEKGGFGKTPKFPSPQNLIFLTRYSKIYKDEETFNMVKKTLKEMSKGGIYDHVGYGFHRYSTDSKWLLPHFEKMLYDQAMLIWAYTEAYQYSKEKLFKEIVEEIIEYLKRDMYNSEGGFYSAEDADSEGEEGKFYVWSYDELKNLLGENFEIFKEISNIKEEGNFREEATGKITYKNIIYIDKSFKEVAKKFNKSEKEVKEIFRNCLKTLYRERGKRVRPLKDTKILTDWNGLIIKALSLAGRVFNNEEYIDLAKKTADFILDSIYINGELFHRYKDGEVKVKANLDDYSFLIFGLIELYQTTFDDKYLKYVLDLTEKMIYKFWDKANGGFYFISSDNKDVLIRQKEIYDGAYPSGNGVAYNCLVWLYKLTGDERFKKYINKMERVFASNIKRVPYGSPSFLIGLMFMLNSTEIIFNGDKEKALKLSQKSEEFYIPSKVLAYNTEFLRKISDFINNIKESKDLEIYLCSNFACQQPIKSEKEFLEKLKQI